jgi:DNA-binding MarR family transcriptional regulator
MADDKALKQARLLHRTIKQLQDRMLRQHGPFMFETDGSSTELTFTQLSTIVAIRDRGEVTLKELSEAMQVSPPSASTMVDKLVELGAIRREHSKVDRREVRVSVSDRGIRLVESLEQLMHESLIELIHGIGPEYAQQWYEVYERIEAYIQHTSPEVSSTSGSAVGVK